MFLYYNVGRKGKEFMEHHNGSVKFDDIKDYLPSDELKTVKLVKKSDNLVEVYVGKDEFAVFCGESAVDEAIHCCDTLMKGDWN